MHLALRFGWTMRRPGVSDSAGRALIVPALGFLLIAMQFRAPTRTSWPRFLACGGAMLLAAAFIGAFYAGATGHVTNKPSVNESLKNIWHLIAGLVGGSGVPVAWAGPGPCSPQHLPPRTARP